MITIFNLAQKGKMASETTMLTWELSTISCDDFSFIKLIIAQFNKSESINSYADQTAARRKIVSEMSSERFYVRLRCGTENFGALFPV